MGVAVYYLGGALRGYVVGQADLVWTFVALVAGPVMGWSAAAIASRPARPPVAAVAAPSAMPVAEAILLAIDRRVWHWNLGAEPYRLIDLGVMLALLLGGLALPALFEKAPRRRGVVYPVVVLVGVCGALGFVLLRRLIAGVA